MIVFGIHCNFLLFYLFDRKFVNLMINCVLQSKIRPSKKLGTPQKFLAPQRVQAISGAQFVQTWISANNQGKKWFFSVWFPFEKSFMFYTL